MENAHLRMGSLEFTRSTSDSITHIKLTMDRFIGEHPRTKGEIGKAHLISVFGNDQDVSAIWSAVILEEPFAVQGPDVPQLIVTLGKDAQIFRGSISTKGRRRPVRHLVALSDEFSQVHSNDASQFGRSIVSHSDPEFILHRLAERFGLPVIPEWKSWFVEELKRKHKIRPVLGVGCSPVVVYGTKETFTQWISSALRRKRISIPPENAPINWEIPGGFILKVSPFE
jgi:hypothetical protein